MPLFVKASKIAAKKSAGFTLLELLVVLVIVGIMLGMVSFSGIQSDQQVLQGEAQRIALLLQLAREEAIVRNSQVGFELDSDRYRFYVKDRDGKGWQLLTDNDLFRERSFKRGPLTVDIQPGVRPTVLPLKIVFGREPVDKPFTLTLGHDNASVSVRADGIGHFTVE